MRQGDFRILDGWKIGLEGRARYKAQACVSRDPKAPKTATIYLWPRDTGMPEPVDFRLHEFIHVGIAALERLPKGKRRDAVETLVQDICRVYRKALKTSCKKVCKLL